MAELHPKHTVSSVEGQVDHSKARGHERHYVEGYSRPELIMIESAG